jgi:hypothetical protein
VQDTLSEKGKAGSPIALALHELQAVDLAFGDPVVECPLILYTDLDTSWLLSEWH